MLVLLLQAWTGIAAAQGVSMLTREVQFQVAPVETNGSLADQAKLARKAIKGKVYRYRAFVLADEDTSPLKDILKAPAVSIIRVSALSSPGARLVLEAVTGGGDNPNGLVHISGQGANRNEHTTFVKPLVETTYQNLDKALAASSVTPDDVLQVTCYLSTLTDLGDVDSLTRTRYPRAVHTYLQIPIPPARGFVECEATARANKAAGYVNPEGLTKSPNFTHAVSINSRNIVWSGLVEARDCTKQSIAEMFRRLDAILKRHGSSVDQVAMSYLYPKSDEATNLTRETRFDFYKRSHPPASTLVPFRGTANTSSCTAVEASAPGR